MPALKLFFHFRGLKAVPRVNQEFSIRKHLWHKCATACWVGALASPTSKCGPIFYRAAFLRPFKIGRNQQTPQHEKMVSLLIDINLFDLLSPRYSHRDTLLSVDLIGHFLRSIYSTHVFSLGCFLFCKSLPIKFSSAYSDLLPR